MASDAVVLRIDIRLDDDADALELDEETLGLRRELLQLDVETVDRPTIGPPPEGTRAVDAVALGSLAVELTTGLIVPVVRSIRAWMVQRGTRSVKLTLDGDSIELPNASDADQQRLLETFLARHATPSG